MTNRVAMAIDGGEREESVTERLLALLDDALIQSGDNRDAAARAVAESLLAQQGEPESEWIDEVIMRALVALVKTVKRKHEKAPKMDVMLAHNGKMVSVPTPKVYSVPQTTETGAKAYVQGQLIIDCAWDDLRRVWNELVDQRDVLDNRAAVIGGLLALKEKAAGARTPREACQMLGMDTQSFTLTLDEAVS